MFLLFFLSVMYNNKHLISLKGEFGILFAIIKPKIISSYQDSIFEMIIE